MAKYDESTWRKARNDYEVVGLTYKRIYEEYGISISSLKRKSKEESWERLNDVIKSIDVRASGMLTSVGIRKIKEIREELGENYSVMDEPLILMFATNYQLWLNIEAQIMKEGYTAISSKRTEYLSPAFLAKTQVEKKIITIATQLGISLLSRKKMGIEAGSKKKEASLFDIVDEIEDVKIEL